MNRMMLICIISLFTSLNTYAQSSILLPSEDVDLGNLRFEEFIKKNQDLIDRSRMGDVVGNGGGLIESQTSYYLNNLDKMITNSIEQSPELFTKTERLTLDYILNVIKLSNFKNKVIFIDDKDFFFDFDDFQERAAKTGFSYKYPIFINRNFIYENISNDLSPMITLLVHELGHQAGIKSHSTLDRLGSKVRQVFMAETQRLGVEVTGKPLTVTHSRFISAGAWPDLTLKYNDKLTSVPKISYEVIKSKCGSNYPINYEFNNLHWATRPIVTESLVYLILEGWVDFKCSNRVGSEVYSTPGVYRLKIKVNNNEVKLQTDVD